MLPTSGFRLHWAPGSSAQNAELLGARRWACAAGSQFSGLSLSAGLPGVVNVRGRRAPTDRSSSRREPLVRLAAPGLRHRTGFWPEAAGPGVGGEGAEAGGPEAGPAPTRGRVHAIWGGVRGSAEERGTRWPIACLARSGV